MYKYSTMHELKSTLYTTMEKQCTVGSFRNIMHELKRNHGSRKLKGNLSFIQK